MLGLIFVFPVRLSAWFHLGAWFLYQLLEANAGLWAADSSGDGVAVFAHVGGFVFGFVATRILMRWGRLQLKPARASDAVDGRPTAWRR